MYHIAHIDLSKLTVTAFPLLKHLVERIGLKDPLLSQLLLNHILSSSASVKDVLIVNDDDSTSSSLG